MYYCASLLQEGLLKHKKMLCYGARVNTLLQFLHTLQEEQEVKDTLI